MLRKINFVFLLMITFALAALAIDPIVKKAESKSISIMTGPQQADPQDAQFGRRRNQNPSPEEEKMLKEQRKIQNKERFEALKKDTDKLVALVNELKQNVDKANENTLSLDVIKKTEEIEKLAKKVRDKMTTSY
jgi:hypothetical protein